MKKKTKPTSVRFDSDLLEELDQRCSEVGCSRNDFIKNSVDFIINNSSDFDFGGDEEEIENEKNVESKPTVTITEITTKDSESKPVMAHGKVLDDYGNVIGTF